MVCSCGTGKGAGFTERPGQEQSKHIRHRDVVHAPFGPFVFISVGEEGHGQQADERGDTGRRHDPHASIRYFARVEADGDEDEDRGDCINVSVFLTRVQRVCIVAVPERGISTSNT